MDDFLRHRESLAALLARFRVELTEIPPALVDALSLRDMSYNFIWAWCQAAELFGRTHRLTPLLCELLARDDHEGHEELADSLQNLRDPTSVDTLFDRANRPLDYLAYDDSAALARRCVWALHDIGTPEAIENLLALASDTREAVSNEVALRLESLGRREAGVVESYRMTRDARLGSL